MSLTTMSSFAEYLYGPNDTMFDQNVVVTGGIDNDSQTTNDPLNTTTAPSGNGSFGDIQFIPHASEVILIILYTATTVAAVVGNCLAILVFAKGKKCNTELKFFLINLAVADLIMAIFCIPFTFFYQIKRHWMFSDVMCPIVQCCQVVSVTASVYTNTAIGIDRRTAVKFPLRKRVTSSKSKFVILAIWIFSWSLGVVPLVMTRTVDQGGGMKSCEEHFPNHTSAVVYGFGIMIITYFLPITILSVTYYSIGRHLWNRNLPGNSDDTRDAQQQESKKKVVKMLATIVLLFGICWLPLHLFMIVFTFNPNAFGDAIYEIYFGVHWLSMANSFVNPVIYGFMNDNFRSDLKVLCLRCCSRKHLKYRTAAMRVRPGGPDSHTTGSVRLLKHNAPVQQTKPVGEKNRIWRNGLCKHPECPSESQVPILAKEENQRPEKVHADSTLASAVDNPQVPRSRKNAHRSAPVKTPLLFQSRGSSGQGDLEENGFLLTSQKGGSHQAQDNRSSRGSDVLRDSPSTEQSMLFEGVEDILESELLKSSNV